VAARFQNSINKKKVACFNVKKREKYDLKKFRRPRQKEERKKIITPNIGGRAFEHTYFRTNVMHNNHQTTCFSIYKMHQ